jgi:hypothetical protein
MQLHKLQQDFFTSLQGKEPSQALLAVIDGTAELSAVERLKIYQHSRIEAIISSLEDSFPVCQQLVGKEFFHAMAWRFAVKQGGASPDINSYNPYFPAFIENFKPAQQLPYLALVAQLEQLIEQLATDYSERIQPQPLAALADLHVDQQAQVIFTCGEPSYLYQADFPVDKIWASNQPDYKGNDRIDLMEGGVYLLIYRRQQVELRRLTEQQYQILTLLKQGYSAEQLCNKLAEQLTEQQIYRLLTEMMETDLINGFIISTE